MTLDPLTEEAAETPPHYLVGDAAILARRYATALADAAEEQKVLGEVQDELRLLIRLIDTDENVRKALVDSVHHLAEERAALATTLTNASHLHQTMRHFLLEVAHENRLHMLRDLCDETLHLFDRRLGVRDVHVSVAQTLTPQQAANLTSILRASFGASVRSHIHVDPAMMAGLALTCEGVHIDLSLKSHLETLRLSLKETL